MQGCVKTKTAFRHKKQFTICPKCYDEMSIGRELCKKCVMRERARAYYRKKIGREPRSYKHTGEHVGRNNRRRRPPTSSLEEWERRHLKAFVHKRCGWCNERLNGDWIESDNTSELGVKYRLHPKCADVINKLESDRSEVIRDNKELGYQQRKGSYCADAMGPV